MLSGECLQVARSKGWKYILGVMAYLSFGTTAKFLVLLESRVFKLSCGIRIVSIQQNKAVESYEFSTLKNKLHSTPLLIVTKLKSNQALLSKINYKIQIDVGICSKHSKEKQV